RQKGNPIVGGPDPAQLRIFDPADDRFGSFSSDRHAQPLAACPLRTRKRTLDNGAYSARHYAHGPPAADCTCVRLRLAIAVPVADPVKAGGALWRAADRTVNARLSRHAWLYLQQQAWRKEVTGVAQGPLRQVA